MGSWLEVEGRVSRAFHVKRSVGWVSSSVSRETVVRVLEGIATSVSRETVGGGIGRTGRDRARNPVGLMGERKVREMRRYGWQSNDGPRNPVGANCQRTQLHRVPWPLSSGTM